MFPRKLFWRTLTFFEFLYPTRTTFGPFLIKSNLFHNSLTVRTEISPHTCFWYQMIAECIRFRKSTWVKGFDSRNFCHGKFFYPYPTKNVKKYNNYVLKLHFRPQIIKIPYIMTVIVLNVVMKTILSSFGNRKSVLIVKKYKKWVFSGIFDFSKNWRINDNFKHILLSVVRNVVSCTRGMPWLSFGHRESSLSPIKNFENEL